MGNNTDKSRFVRRKLTKEFEFYFIRDTNLSTWEAVFDII